MAIAYLRPSAVGTYNFWTLGAGASKEAACDPGASLSHDENTSYISIGLSPGANNQQSFYLNTGLPAAIKSVNSVAMNFRHRTSGTGGVEGVGHFLRLGSTNGTGYGFTMQEGYLTATTSSYGRPGGGSWVPGDFTTNNIQGASYVNSDNAQPARVTSIWATLDYEVPDAVGGFAFGVASILGALGAGILLREVPLMQIALARRGWLLSREEVLKTWQELRSHRYPKHFDMRLKAA